MKLVQALNYHNLVYNSCYVFKVSDSVVKRQEAAIVVAHDAYNTISGSWNIDNFLIKKR